MRREVIHIDYQQVAGAADDKVDSNHFQSHVRLDRGDDVLNLTTALLDGLHRLCVA